MAIVLLAAALLAQPPESGRLTARQLYDRCVRVVAPEPASPPATNDAAIAEAAEAAAEQVTCEVYIAVQNAQRAANDAMPDNDPGRTESFCAPDSVLAAEDATQQLARAYVAWFDRHPADQNATDADATLGRALRETWPCPPR
jgi:hypothetical protein